MEYLTAGLTAVALVAEQIELGKRRARGDPELALATERVQRADARLKELRQELEKQAQRADALAKEVAGLRTRNAEQESLIESLRCELEEEGAAQAARHLATLCCPVCHEHIERASVYPCGHTVCQQCLESPPAREMRKLCPVCRRPHAGQVSPNYQLNSLLESLASCAGAAESE
jgi:hypothetical protein